MIEAAPFDQKALAKMLQERLGDLVGNVEPGGKEAGGQEQAASDDDFVATFDTPAGQKVLLQLVSMTLLSPSWNFDQPSGYGYFREGQNSMVQHIIDKMHAARAKHGDSK